VAKHGVVGHSKWTIEITQTFGRIECTAFHWDDLKSSPWAGRLWNRVVHGNGNDKKLREYHIKYANSHRKTGTGTRDSCREGNANIEHVLLC